MTHLFKVGKFEESFFQSLFTRSLVGYNGNPRDSLGS